MVEGVNQIWSELELCGLQSHFRARLVVHAELVEVHPFPTEEVDEELQGPSKVVENCIEQSMEQRYENLNLTDI